ncbi:alpha/beta hydrolase [Ornithinimicrobium sp. LYQ92]|uniref:alpha/beta hydrolase n=1 Tax=Serinicoccus sp. LYQ92 TaxID=3378798 RepID=UPI0038551EF4
MSLGIDPWMVSDAEPVRTAGGTLTSAADLVSQERATVRTTLGQAATALGWEGRLTDRAEETSSGSQDAFRTLEQDLDAGGRALVDLADAMTVHGATLRTIQSDWDTLQGDRPQTEVRGDLGEQVEVTDYEELRRQEQALRDRAQAPMEDLRTADRACHGSLVAVESSLRALVPHGSSSTFTRSLVPADAWGVFRGHGVVDSRAEEGLLGELPDPPTAQDIRSLLDQLDPGRVEAFLARHPGLLTVLAQDYAPEDVDDPVLSGLWDAVGDLDADGMVADPAAIEDIRSYWGELTPVEQRRMRLLYPAFIGRLDGIPVEHRAGANRVLIQSAIDAEEARLAVLESMPDNDDVREDVTDRLSGIYPDWLADLVVDGLTHDEAQTLLTDFRLRDQELARSRARLGFYQELLEPQPATRSRFADVTDDAGVILPADARAVLLFDPRGDGRFAEWHGEFDSENVAVFVPGTTTDMSNIGSYADRILTLADEQDTSSITWMGTDLPNAVAGDATQTRYSEDGGQALLRFVEGLGMSERTVTAVGHSAGGGIVGFADVFGMDVDRTLLIAPSGSGLGLHRPMPFPMDPWGAEPTTPSEYPPQTWDGEARDVQRFTQTAPGDSIHLAQRSEDVRWWVGLPEDWGHGDDPNSSDQFIRLETGRFDDGTLLEGFGSHSHVVEPGTDAWRNFIGVVTGGDVIPYQEEGFWLGRDNVYDDADYPGTDPVPIEELMSVWDLEQPMIMAPGPLEGSFGDPP